MLALLAAASLALSPSSLAEAFGVRSAAFVVLDPQTGEVFRNDPAACAEPLPPCSTFKIWNTAIGLENGLITSADAPFWKWDGQKRALEPWNHDQTLRSAFAVSCVPAYQALARKIGVERMKTALHQLAYGDENISAGLDVFWLPEAGRKTILISPDAQAGLIARLVAGKVPFSARTRAILKDVMKFKQTKRGTLYGKTGSSGHVEGRPDLGWFVGYVESDGRTYPFACALQGKDVMGMDARDAVEKILTDAALL
jgi:beta-lactamase class D